MRIKYLKYVLTILCFVLFSYNNIYAKSTGSKNSKNSSDKKTERYYIWPVIYGGGSFFFDELGPAKHLPGYLLSGGGTFALNESGFVFFADVLFSYRDYEGYPQKVDYHVKEVTADLALAAGVPNFFYGGVYIQFPLSTSLSVSQWTIEDFDSVSRYPSFSFMGGFRLKGEHLGVDIRLLLGQGPGQYLSKSLGDNWLGQLSVGFMAGF